MAGAGIDRTTAYVTNVVKHFKWKAAGKRRLHQKPNAAEIKACKPWLAAEVDRVQPHVVVLLGATAAQAVMGSSFKVTQQRGELLDGPPGAPGRAAGVQFLATVHPSSILRAPDEAGRHQAYSGLVTDLRVVATALSRFAAQK